MRERERKVPRKEVKGGHIVDKNRSRPLLYTLHEGNCTGTDTHTFIALHNPDVLLSSK